MNTVRPWIMFASAFIFLWFMAMPFAPAQAQTSTMDTLAELKNQIAVLLEQVQSLQNQIASLRTEQREVRSEIQTARREFRAYLREGVRNEEVRSLQEFLAADSSLYPEGLITGYYGPITAEAVRRFQARHGIDRAGVVGPKTRARLNNLLTTGAGKSSIIPPGLVRRFGNAGTTTGTGTSTTTLPAFGKNSVEICHNAARNNPHTITIAFPALAAHIGHGDTVGKCSGENDTDNEDENDDTMPDTTAPALSDISIASTTAATTHIIWNTDESADGAAWFGTTTPLTVENALSSVSHSDFVTGHNILLDGLTASTTYYVFLSSADAAGNRATSTEQSFATE